MIKFAKVREVREPSRGTNKSAGIDFYVPMFTDSYIQEFNRRNPNARSMCSYSSEKKIIVVKPHGQVQIPLGIITSFIDEEDSVLLFHDKSGISWEHRLTLLGGVVDQDYQGEIIASFVNYTDYNTSIVAGMKLIQAIRTPVYYDDIQMVDKDDIHLVATDRGTGGYGSTNKV